MADPSEFSSAELDRLEDGLERLDVLLEGDPTDEVAKRLDEYRSVLTLVARELPHESPSSSALERVLLAAREAVDQAASAPPVQPEQKPSVWSRVKRTLWMPGLGLGVAGLLVLIIVRRNPDLAHDEPVATAAKAVQATPAKDQLLGPIERSPQHGGGAAPPGASPVEVPSAGDARKAEVFAEEAPKMASAPHMDNSAALYRPARAGASGRSSTSSVREKPSASAQHDERARREAAPASYPSAFPQSPPEPAAKRAEPIPDVKEPVGGAPVSKGAPAPEATRQSPGTTRSDYDQALTEPSEEARSDDGWAAIAEGDRTRHARNCTAARQIYVSLIRGTSRDIKARAYAGLGLCAELEGRRAQANAAYRRAHRLAQGIDDFIRAEGGHPTP